MMKSKKIKNPHKFILLSTIPIFILVFVFAFFSIINSDAEPNRKLKLTQEEKDWLADHQDKLILYFNTEFPPMEFISDNGEFIGLGADIFKIVEQRLDIKFKKIAMPDWNQHLKALETGECAIAPTIAKTPERESFAFFTDAYTVVPVVIIAKRTDKREITLDQLEGKKLAVVSGYATEQYLNDLSLLYHFNVMPYKNVTEALHSVSFGQTDALVENLAVAAYFIEKNNIPNLQVVGQTDYSFSLSIGISRHYPLLYSSIQKALRSISNHEMRDVSKKWIQLDTSYGLDPLTWIILKLVALFVIFLIIGLVLISLILKHRLKVRLIDLHRSEEKYKRLAEKSPAVVFQLLTKSKKNISFSYINESVYELTGIHAHDLMNDSSLFFKKIYKDDYRKFYHSAVASAKHLQAFSNVFRFLKNEQIIYLSPQSTPELLPDGSILWDGFCIDVTDQIKSEAKLKESEEKYRRIAENTSDIIWATDMNLKTYFVSQSVYKVLGYTVKEYLSRNLQDNYTPESLKIINQVFEENLKLESDPNADKNRNRIFEVQQIKSDGSLLWVSLNASFMRDESGKTIGIQGVTRDISELKAAELKQEKLQEQLMHAQKMESVGRLAGGVAHDFNNMLGVIIGHAELAFLKVNPDDSIYNNLFEIKNAAERSANLTRQLLAFARRQAIEPKVIDLNVTIEGMLKMLRRLIGEDITLEWHPKAKLWNVKVDPSQIDQILANLCVNARDAIVSNGKLIIETDNVSINQNQLSINPDFYIGNFVRISVTDNGSGIDKETLSHIFEPFFTTKEIGKGTGLGLATIYGAVKQNNGFIDVQSELGKGTSFSIYFPQYIDENNEDRSVDSEEHIPGGNETILLVEDEPAILSLGVMMLENLGYEVLATGSSLDALKIAKEKNGKIDLLLTDVIMPQMNGRELIDRMIESYPKLKYIFMSGYTSNIIAPHGVLKEGIFFIQKPFTLSNLAITIRKVLDQKD